MTLDEDEVIDCVRDDEAPRIARWLANFREDEFVETALDRLLTAARQLAN